MRNGSYVQALRFLLTEKMEMCKRRILSAPAEERVFLISAGVLIPISLIWQKGS